MADFIGNYYQHIMDSLISEYELEDDIIYEKAECYYNEMYKKSFDEQEAIRREKLARGKKCKENKLKQINADSIKHSHTRRDRGNIPGSLKPEKFYESILQHLLYEVEIWQFMNNLCETLIAHDMFPKEWEDRYKLLTPQADDEVDEELVGEFLISLLKLDEDGKILTATPLSRLKKEDVVVENKSGSEKTEAPEITAQSLSSRFFTAGARCVVGLPDEELDKELQKLSGVFKNIMRIYFKNPTEAFVCSDNFISELGSWIVSYINKSGKKDVLKVKGPLGSYKNRLMQYLYISLLRKAETFIPIYIDIASYEKAAEENERIDEKDFIKAFDKDIKTAQEIFSREPSKKPLLILDGIRDFYFKNESLYYAISERIQKSEWYSIICEDAEFTVNNQNKFDVHPLVSGNYACYLRLRSMNLNRKADSIEFIRNCIDVFEVPLQSEVSPEVIYDNLVRLNFLTLDAYWLTYILRSHLDDIINPHNTIAGLYNAISFEFLGSHKLVESAAEFAYDFEYGDGNFDNVNPYYDLRWRFIRKHRSVLDFLISKEYVRRVTGIKLEDGNDKHNKKQLKIFEMVLQEYIARFVFIMLKGNENYEHLILKIAQDHYGDLSTIGKSELSFRMTSLKNNRRKNECIRLISRYNRMAIKEYEENSYSSQKEKTDAAFLIRSLNINLIYYVDSNRREVSGDREAFEYYANMLLTDKLANEINRAFHLEYYGDKPYIPNKSLLDFEDDITKGFKTFNRLCLILDKRISNPDGKTYAAAIEIMSLCNLLQARMTDSCKKVFDITPFAVKCMDYIEWIEERWEIKNIDSVKFYFNWMHGELSEFVNNKSRYNKALVYNRLKEKCPEAEVTSDNIFENTDEHIYSCWLMGMLYLPNTYDDPGYSKNDILQMLLIHELWKKDCRAGKAELSEYPDDTVMRSLLMTGTYPESVNLSRYVELWNLWQYEEGINSQVALDIDAIQTVYCFCDSYLRDPDRFSTEDLRFWVGGIDDIETDIGKDIADTLIINNPKYKTVMEIYSSAIDE